MRRVGLLASTALLAACTADSSAARPFPSAVLVGADGRIERRRVLVDEFLAPPR